MPTRRESGYACLGRGDTGGGGGRRWSPWRRGWAACPRRHGASRSSQGAPPRGRARVQAGRDFRCFGSGQHVQARSRPSGETHMRGALARCATGLTVRAVVAAPLRPRPQWGCRRVVGPPFFFWMGAPPSRRDGGVGVVGPRGCPRYATSCFDCRGRRCRSGGACGRSSNTWGHLAGPPFGARQTSPNCVGASGGRAAFGATRPCPPTLPERSRWLRVESGPPPRVRPHPGFGRVARPGKDARTGLRGHRLHSRGGGGVGAPLLRTHGAVAYAATSRRSRTGATVGGGRFRASTSARGGASGSVGRACAAPPPGFA